MADTVSLCLREWETRDPVDCPELKGRHLESGSSVSLAASMAQSRQLRVTDLHSGLTVETFSYVGRVRIDDLEIAILPKLRGVSIMKLLRYAYGLRDLALIGDASQLLETSGFQDLLIAQLNAEAQELVSRGLQRSYVTRSERLASPRGRIDLQKLAQCTTVTSGRLPCRHFPRLEDTLLNQVLLAGLRLAAKLAQSLTLRRETAKLATLLDEQVGRVPLSSTSLDRAERSLNRLTNAYRPVLTITRMLAQAHGVTLEGEARARTLSGFLFDMNRFFQAVLSRFLRDNLDGYEVVDEHALKGMMRYRINFDPPRRAPTPRPDFVIRQGNGICAILDAKYRDLWEKDLPSSMLYQLVIYAISQRDKPRSTILYPTLHPNAPDRVIDIRDPVDGYAIGSVCLRAVNLNRIESLVSDTTTAARRARAEYAKRLALAGTD